MSAEPGTDKAVRREKIVMALGIATIILFSANLLTMVARHVWPDFRFGSLFGVEQMDAVSEVDGEHTVHVFVNRHGDGHEAHRFVIRLNGADVHYHARDSFRETADRIESELRVEMERLSRDIARQQSRMEADMATRGNVRRQERELDGALDQLESELATLQNALLVKRSN